MTSKVSPKKPPKRSLQFLACLKTPLTDKERKQDGQKTFYIFGMFFVACKNCNSQMSFSTHCLTASQIDQTHFAIFFPNLL